MRCARTCSIALRRLKSPESRQWFLAMRERCVSADADHGLGLLAAIPAVIYYNKFSADSDRIVGGYEAFADEFATILSRQLDS